MRFYIYYTKGLFTKHLHADKRPVSKPFFFFALSFVPTYCQRVVFLKFIYTHNRYIYVPVCNNLKRTHAYYTVRVFYEPFIGGGHYIIYSATKIICPTIIPAFVFIIVSDMIRHNIEYYPKNQ